VYRQFNRTLQHQQEGTLAQLILLQPTSFFNHICRESGKFGATVLVPILCFDDKLSWCQSVCEPFKTNLSIGTSHQKVTKITNQIRLSCKELDHCFDQQPTSNQQRLRVYSLRHSDPGPPAIRHWSAADRHGGT